MKIAISTDNGQVSPHFGRCPEFTVVDIKDGKVVSKEKIANPGHHPGFLPQFFSQQGVEAIIAGGMGHRAQALFDEMGIRAVMGISGPIDEVTEKLATGTLEGGESLCLPGSGKGYGLDKTECDHPEERETAD